MNPFRTRILKNKIANIILINLTILKPTKAQGLARIHP